jgi:hypothetical protein
MDQKVREAFMDGQDKIGKYLQSYGTPEKCQKRTNDIYNYLIKNNTEVIAVLFAQVTPMLMAMKMDPTTELNIDNSLVQSVIKMLIFMMDSMDFSDYIDIKFLTPELKVNKYNQEVKLNFPKEMFKKVEEDNKKKNDKNK